MTEEEEELSPILPPPLNIQHQSSLLDKPQCSQSTAELTRMTSVTSGIYNSNPVGSTEPLYEKKYEGFALWCSRMRGLMVKRIVYTQRKFILFAVMVIKIKMTLLNLAG